MGIPSAPTYAPHEVSRTPPAALALLSFLAHPIISFLCLLVTSIGGVLEILGIVQLLTFAGRPWRRSCPPADGVVEVPEPDRPQTSQVGNSSNVPGRDRPPSHEIPADRAATRLASHAHTHRSGHRCTPVAEARRFSPANGKLQAALTGVAQLRHSVQHNRYRHPESLKSTMKLAAALSHLSVLQAEAGRTREALESSRESAELFRDLPEMMHRSRHSTR